VNVSSTSRCYLTMPTRERLLGTSSAELGTTISLYQDLPIRSDKVGSPRHLTRREMGPFLVHIEGRIAVTPSTPEAIGQTASFLSVGRRACRVTMRETGQLDPQYTLPDKIHANGGFMVQAERAKAPRNLVSCRMIQDTIKSMRSVIAVSHFSRVLFTFDLGGRTLRQEPSSRFFLQHASTHAHKQSSLSFRLLNFLLSSNYPTFAAKGHAQYIHLDGIISSKSKYIALDTLTNDPFCCHSVRKYYVERSS
jgi:hypothetical protein